MMPCVLRPPVSERPARRWIGPGLILVMLAAASCGFPPFSTRPGMLEVRSQTLSNGYLIALSADRKLEVVTAFIARDNWLVITIVDSLLETSDRGVGRPSFADSVEVTRFPGSLQLAFHLTVQVKDVEVVHHGSDPTVWISLFALPEQRRRP